MNYIFFLKDRYKWRTDGLINHNLSKISLTYLSTFKAQKNRRYDYSEYIFYR